MDTVFEFLICAILAMFMVAAVVSAGLMTAVGVVMVNAGEPMGAALLVIGPSMFAQMMIICLD